MRRTKKFSLSKERKELVITRITKKMEETPEIIFAFLHGSFLDEGPFGDVDLALFVKAPCPATGDKALEYELKMEMLLENITAVPVDVRILNQAPSLSVTACSKTVVCFSAGTKSFMLISCPTPWFHILTSPPIVNVT